MDEMLAWNYNKNGIFLDDKKKSRHGFGARAAWRVRINIGADEAAGMCNQTLPPPHRTEWAAKSLKLNPTKAWAVLSSNEEESMAHIGMRADCSGGQRQKIYISVALSVIKQLVPLYKSKLNTYTSRIISTYTC